MKFLSNRQYNALVESLVEAREILLAGTALTAKQQQMLEEGVRYIAQLEQANLENLRVMQTLAATILLVRANPEADVAEDVEALLREISDKVALIEEHLA